MPGPDPAMFLRAMMGEWERLSGGGSSATAEPGKSGTGSAGPNWQSAIEGLLGRSSASAGASASEVAELNARVGRIEAALFRIEALLSEMRQDPGATPSSPSAPAPSDP